MALQHGLADQTMRRLQKHACLRSVVRPLRALAVLGAIVGAPCAAHATDPSVQTFSIHGQITHLRQYHPAFRSLYRGANSLDPGSRGNETTDMTLYLGAHLWKGGRIEADPEIDQGFGLSNTMGVAAFPSGEAYKLGKTSPYLRLQRLFIQETILLDATEDDPSPDQSREGRANNTLTLTAGKFSVVDMFDTNRYAHDPRTDFMNWAIIDAGAFDYAGDAWGYSYGLAAETTHDPWTLRLGVFNLSRVPGGTELQRNFGQFEFVEEIERGYTLCGERGSLKLLGFLNRGRMGAYADAVRLAITTHTIPSTVFVRWYALRPGGEINVEQQISDHLGIFARASVNDGTKETFDFSDINESLTAGLSLKGLLWDRPQDTVGLAIVASWLSNSARAYFAAGGLGILIGDGGLAHYGSENVIEGYYSLAIVDGVAVTADYQWIDNPAYNRDRGPVSVLSVRLHAAV